MPTPFAQTIVRDTFTRANSGTLGANWTANSDATTTGTMGIVSNSAQPSVGGNAASFYSAAVFNPDQYSQCILSTSATGTNTHGGGPTVRGSAGGYYRFFGNMTGTVNSAQILKVVAGVATAISLANDTFNSGDLLRLEVIGTTLNAYHNGVLVCTATDSALPSGAPGVCAFTTTASPTALVTSFECGDLLWTRKGTVIPNTTGNGGGTQEPSVIYEANPQILSANADGKIWKMWYTNGWTNPVVINYAESNNGVTWTQYSGNPVISLGGTQLQHGQVLHIGNTYYGFIGNSLNAANGVTPQLDLWQSSNGVTGWTRTNVAVLSKGGVGTWDSTEVANPCIFPQSGGGWNMLYTGSNSGGGTYGIGLATSPDLVTWTKSASNPVVASTTLGAGPDKNVIKNGNLYYMLAHSSPPSVNLPTDLYWLTSPDLINWTNPAKNPYYIRVLADEGPNLPASGQIADGCWVELNGTTYQFHDAVNVQSAGHIEINLETAPYTMLQLLGMVVGNTIIAGNCGVAGATINYSGAASGSVTADAFGNFVIPIFANGAYTITPSLTGATFSPPSKSCAVSSADVIGVNFSGSTGSGGFGEKFTYTF